jgi:Na+-translocating ferredoxin:NAD+ oxidoreductase subunit G
MKESIVKHAASTAAIMVLFAVVGTGILAVIHEVTRAPISQAEAKVRMALFSQVLPQDLYDNDLLKDAIKVSAGGELGNRAETEIYRARLKGEPSAIVLEATAPDGYSGDIRLLIAIKVNGEIAGVRVLEHKETPGLGDYIDIAHSAWIKNFDTQSLSKINDDGWQVKKDGGVFEYTSGATITPRAVVKAIHKVLAYYQQHQAEILNAPVSSGQKMSVGDKK